MTEEAAEAMTIKGALKQAIIEQFGTPCAVVDLDVVDRNIAKLQSLCDAAGLANRPHIKTHKSPFLAQRQMATGAIGITCQKLGEAEIMAAAGITDILIATNILGGSAIRQAGGPAAPDTAKTMCRQPGVTCRLFQSRTDG